jgi:hypothetical protein
MSAGRRFIVMMCAISIITAIVSHSIVWWLRIEIRSGGYWNIGQEEGRETAFVAGSSLAGDALALRKVREKLNLNIEGWGVAGSSPSEWEQFQYRASHAKSTIIVVSAYDLNEYIFSDFRADVVPLKQSVNDLWESGMDWQYSKRLLSLYPLSYLRILYPTAGRSDGVMVGLRKKLTEWGGGTYLSVESERRPTLSFKQDDQTRDYHDDKVSNWSVDRVVRRLSTLRATCYGIHKFTGPKNLAFRRMLRRAEKQGRVTVVVLPVSPIYKREFLTEEVNRNFDQALEETRKISEASWIRLDRLKNLESNDLFWDFVHMNALGREIATQAFLQQFTDLSFQ